LEAISGGSTTGSGGLEVVMARVRAALSRLGVGNVRLFPPEQMNVISKWHTGLRKFLPV
jgi:hypothetical protein